MDAATIVGGVIETFLGPSPPLHLTCWDGSDWGDESADFTVHVRSPDALRRLLWNPDELGLGRAYVAGDLEIDGSIFDLFDLRDRITERVDSDASLALTRRQQLALARDALRLGVLGRRPPPPPEEARLRGRLHSIRRDKDAITHHYDVGNDFYRLVLGPTMTYSCAFFPTATTTLEQAQTLKHEHICRKLGLQPGQRLLDVGCGWGSMAIHAAREHGVEVVAVTISDEQAALARARVHEAGLDDRVEIRIQDYREITDGPFDAVASIGMFEHVGAERTRRYFQQLRGLLKPGGRLMNHAISRTEGEGPLERDSFPARYVFPDGQLHEVGRTVSLLQDEGFECRDVESLREHYARTLRCWVANLEDHWDEAVELVGPGRARVWRLYMAGSAVGFEGHRINIHQVLAARPHPSGDSGMPRTRPDTVTEVARVDAVDTVDLRNGRRDAPSVDLAQPAPAD